MAVLGPAWVILDVGIFGAFTNLCTILWCGRHLLDQKNPHKVPHTYLCAASACLLVANSCGLPVCLTTVHDGVLFVAFNASMNFFLHFGNAFFFLLVMYFEDGLLLVEEAMSVRHRARTSNLGHRASVIVVTGAPLVLTLQYRHHHQHHHRHHHLHHQAWSISSASR